MHSNPDFWASDESYVDFPRDRFLEYTEENIKDEFRTLNEETINKLKDIPVLFATEEEKSDTKIGSIVNIEIFSKSLRIYFKFHKKPPLFKGVLENPTLNIDKNTNEMYRTHWAIKQASFFDFYAARQKTLEGKLDELKGDLDADFSNKINVVTLFAYNGSGKTRISKHFQEQYNDKVLCYNAFVEDYFSWNNEASILSINTKSWAFKVIKEQELSGRIIDNFKDIIDSKLEPDIDYESGNIHFKISTGDSQSRDNVKISRGEESIFKFSVFLAIVGNAIDMLDESEDTRSTDRYNHIKYIIIDDPVSSIDDSKIISTALKVIGLIKKSKNKFNFLITTHHPLFFNVFFTKSKKMDFWNKKNYILAKSNDLFELKKQGNESPFAYHHLIISELKEAINHGSLKKYHFNLFRALLEKFSNFLGYDHWKKCLVGIKIQESFEKVIDHYSHDRLSEMEYNNLIEKETQTFKETFYSFCKKYRLGEDNA
jgi:hypothetical protein